MCEPPITPQSFVPTKDSNSTYCLLSKDGSIVLRALRQGVTFSFENDFTKSVHIHYSSTNDSSAINSRMAGPPNQEDMSGGYETIMCNKKLMSQNFLVTYSELFITQISTGHWKPFVLQKVSSIRESNAWVGSSWGRRHRSS